MGWQVDVTDDALGNAAGELYALDFQPLTTSRFRLSVVARPTTPQE